jgi:hypothetical protein
LCGGFYLEDKMNIKIDPEFQRMIPPLRSEEYANLESNIKREGCRDPLVVWKRGKDDYVLLDGHNRKEICEEHDIAYAVNEKEFEDREAAADWMDKNQLGRRNLTKDDFNLLIGRRYNRLKKKQGGDRGNQYTIAKNDDVLASGQNGHMPKARDLIAQEHEVGPRTVQRAGKLAEAVDQVAAMPESQQLTQPEIIAEAKKIVHVSQNTGEMEWYTPENIIEMAREAMGSIDCDPASSDIANNVVKALMYFTENDNGLEKEWAGNVWLNPPFKYPLIQQFLDTLIFKYHSGEINQACIFCNNATDTEWWQTLARKSACVCFVKGRLRCYRPDGSTGQSPLQGQTIVYFGVNKDRFCNVFKSIGSVMINAE